MNKDLQYLKILSIFYYVVGGILAVFACFPIIHFIVGLMMLVAPNKMSGSGPPPPAFVGWMFVLIAGLIILSGWAMAVALMFAGWYLRRCEHYIFCLIMAGVACLFHPLGTILGVFTIILLIRPTVKELFETGIPAEQERDPDEEETPRVYDDHIRRDSLQVRGEF